MWTEDPESGENDEENQIEPRRSLADALAHFHTDPSMKKWLENDSYEAPDWLNRETMPGGSNRFFQKTLNTDITVPYMVHVVRRDLKAPKLVESLPDIPNVVRRPTKIERQPDLVSMMCLKSDGLDGWPGITHGGMNVTMLDQGIGNLISALRMEPSSNDQGGALFTANLNTSYFRPVQTGGSNILIKAWAVGRTKRRWTAVAQIIQDGVVMCQGDALFIVTHNPKI